MTPDELNDVQSSVFSLLTSIQQATNAESPTPKDMKLLNSVDDSKQKEKKRQIGQVGGTRNTNTFFTSNKTTNI